MEAKEMVTDGDLLQALAVIDDVRTQTLKLLDLQESAIEEAGRTATATVGTAAGEQDASASPPLAHTTSSTAPTDLEKQMAMEQAELMCRAAELRGVYRQAIMSTRTTKDATAQARAQVDSLHLQLQNLLYEQKHLMGEIAGCQGYHHKYSSLALIPLNEFIQLFPAKAQLSDHELMLARIDHERTQRQSLEEKRQGLLKQKQGLIAQNNRRKEELASLDKDLKSYFEGATPILKTLQKEYYA